MDRNETKKILISIQAAYPNFKIPDKTVAVELWGKMLAPYPYISVDAALQSYILTDTSGFAPSIGQIVRILNKPADGMNETEAWSLVRNAIRNGYYGAEKEFNNLPPVVQKAVGSPENLRSWSQAETRTVDTVVQAAFFKAYRTAKERERENALIPESVRKLLEQSAGRLAVEDKGMVT